MERTRGAEGGEASAVLAQIVPLNELPNGKPKVLV